MRVQSMLDDARRLLLEDTTHVLFGLVHASLVPFARSALPAFAAARCPQLPAEVLAAAVDTVARCTDEASFHTAMATLLDDITVCAARAGAQ
jgi:hypothetical protein